MLRTAALHLIVAEYIRKLRELCFYLAEAAITQQYESRDTELLQMVRTLDQLDEVSNVLTERALEWHRINNPAFSRKYMRLPKQKLLPMMKRGGSPAFRQIISEIENLASARTALMKEVSRRADEVVPNCSALLGGLVAARLVSQAGSLATLSSLPGSSIQVLGARTALVLSYEGWYPATKTRNYLSAPKGPQCAEGSQGKGGAGSCGKARNSCTT